MDGCFGTCWLRTSKLGVTSVPRGENDELCVFMHIIVFNLLLGRNSLRWTTRGKPNIFKRNVEAYKEIKFLKEFYSDVHSNVNGRHQKEISEVTWHSDIPEADQTSKLKTPRFPQPIPTDRFSNCLPSLLRRVNKVAERLLKSLRRSVRPVSTLVANHHAYV